MADDFADWRSGLDSPAVHAVAVTPSNSTDLSTSARSLYVGTGGDVVLDTVGAETSVTFANVAAGTVLPVRVARVRATGTTASNIVALY